LDASERALAYAVAEEDAERRFALADLGGDIGVCAGHEGETFEPPLDDGVPQDAERQSRGGRGRGTLGARARTTNAAAERERVASAVERSLDYEHDMFAGLLAEESRAAAAARACPPSLSLSLSLECEGRAGDGGKFMLKQSADGPNRRPADARSEKHCAKAASRAPAAVATPRTPPSEDAEVFWLR
jgi:hypothetical protein